MSNLSIRFGQFDPTAKADSSLSVTDQKPWSNLDVFKREGVKIENFMTNEPNHDILNETMYEFPDNTSLYAWGWWSESMSDDSGVFDVPPTLDITFGSLHKSPGLTLFFYPYPDNDARFVKVTWYDGTQTAIHSGTYTITPYIGTINEPVYGWKRIKIEVLATSVRNRYVKMYGIDYGVVRTFSDDTIDTATILEEVDPISDIISVNTLNFRLKLKEPDFSPVLGKVSGNALMRNQFIQIFDEGSLFGTFFTQTWKDVYNTGVVYDFYAHDAIGAMDRCRFMGGMYVDMSADFLLKYILYVCFPTGLISCELDPYLSDAKVTGWIPICTCREALQLICFAIGAIADTSRRDYVWVYPTEDFSSQSAEIIDIPLIDAYIGGEIAPTTYYSGIDVISYNYVGDATIEMIRIDNSIYLPGTYTIEFPAPMYMLSTPRPTDATIIEQSINYAVYKVHAKGVLDVSGQPYLSNQQRYSIRAEHEPGEVENIAVFDKCTLMSRDRVEAVAQNIWRYLQYKMSIENDIRIGKAEVGYIAKMHTYGYPIVGMLERLELNLRGGRAKARVVGDVVESNMG